MIEDYPLHRKIRIKLTGSLISYEGSIEYINGEFVIFRDIQGKTVSIRKQLIEGIEAL